jgi:hypothetical protein
LAWSTNCFSLLLKKNCSSLEKIQDKAIAIKRNLNINPMFIRSKM